KRCSDQNRQCDRTPICHNNRLQRIERLQSVKEKTELVRRQNNKVMVAWRQKTLKSEDYESRFAAIDSYQVFTFGAIM
ncbi:unnamed protein product, partial [Larinioides sclopetarius]